MDRVAQSIKTHIRNRNTAATYSAPNTHAAKPQFATKTAVASRTSQICPSPLLSYLQILTLHTGRILQILLLPDPQSLPDRALHLPNNLLGMAQA
jgi:hypothetical protein